MKISNPGSSRPAWYDRNPLPVSEKFFTQTLAPAGVTAQWTYTVPTGRKAMVESAFCYLDRATVATTAGYAQAFIQYLPQGVAAADMVQAAINNNAVDSSDKAINAGTAVMVAGDQLRGQTSDASVGGTYRADVIAKLTEFDA